MGEASHQAEAERQLLDLKAEYAAGLDTLRECESEPLKLRDLVATFESDDAALFDRLAAFEQVNREVLGRLDDLRQRTSTEHPDGTHWSYLYNPRGEVTSASKISGNNYLPGMRNTYTYDLIGNRDYSRDGGDKDGADTRLTSYRADANNTPGANTLNQYEEIHHPREFSVVGRAADPTAVEISGTTPGPDDIRGSDFRVELAAPGTGATMVDVVCEENNVQLDTGTRYVPPAVEQLAYDADGNLESDGRWAYTWDADNRLTQMESHAAIHPAVPRMRLEFAYDYAGRRAQKTVHTGYDPNTGTYATTETQLFIYDGCLPPIAKRSHPAEPEERGINLVARLDAAGTPEQTYTWGLDLSGTMQGAGGVGGLLWITDAPASANPATHFASYDGNGNLTALSSSAAAATQTATYDYDAFGNLVRRTGAFAEDNPFQFSTKYVDESGLVYYGFRYYDPETGRWLNRDPIGERGGINLYGFVRNDGVSWWDLLGAKPWDEFDSPIAAFFDAAHHIAEEAKKSKAKGWIQFRNALAAAGVPHADQPHHLDMTGRFLRKIDKVVKSDFVATRYARHSFAIVIGREKAATVYCYTNGAGQVKYSYGDMEGAMPTLAEVRRGEYGSIDPINEGGKGPTTAHRLLDYYRRELYAHSSHRNPKVIGSLHTHLIDIYISNGSKLKLKERPRTPGPSNQDRRTARYQQWLSVVLDHGNGPLDARTTRAFIYHPVFGINFDLYFGP